MTQTADIPLTVIGGFLGAGKTTLLNYLLRSQHTERVLVMVNDFGAINIDAELIIAQPGEANDIITLSNGCACCSIGGDLMQAFLRIASMPIPPDRIVIEASGVAEPDRIAQIGRISAGLRDEGVVTLVDAAAIRNQASDRYIGTLVLKQLKTADIVVINKTDLLGPDELVSLRRWLEQMAPTAKQIACRQGEVQAEIILGSGLLSDQRLLEHQEGQSKQQNLDDIFHTSCFTSRLPLCRARLHEALEHLPENILRGKGLVYLEENTNPFVLQFSGRRWSLSPYKGHARSTVSRLVFIGLKTDESQRWDPWLHFKSAPLKR